MSRGRDTTHRIGRAARCLTAGTIVASAAIAGGSAGTAHAAGGLIISEVAPWGSGNSGYAADWFELTNTGGAAVDITGWKMDDNSNSFAASVALNGVTSIGAGESVVFIESATPATVIPLFTGAWFGGSAPAGLHIGTYTGSGVGLSTGGDAVNVYNAAGALQANVTFGASPTVAPFSTFDNAAGVDNAAVTTLSVAGVNGGFLVPTPAATAAIGSPGTVSNGSAPPPATTTTAPGATTTTIATTTTAPPALAWPGGSTVDPVDQAGLVTQNLSGLTYEGSGSATPGVLWGVDNNAPPGSLFRLVFNGTNWVPDAGDWAGGKALKYTDGTGNPDSEDLTFGGPTSASGIFVATERNNDASATSKNAILRFDPSIAGTTSTATQQRDLTADLPANGVGRRDGVVGRVPRAGQVPPASARLTSRRVPSPRSIVWNRGLPGYSGGPLTGLPGSLATWPSG